VIDVAIVGGGPAGLLASAHLARSGLDVSLLEEHPRVGEPTHCTGIVSLETAGLAAIPDHLVLSRLTRARLVAPNGGEARHAWPAAGEDTILAIDRAAFDQGLASQAIDAGASIRTGVPVREIQVAHDGVVLRTGMGPVRARACVTEVDATPGDAVELHFGRQVAPSGFAWTVPVQRPGRHRLKVGVMSMGDAGARLDAFLARPSVRARLLGEPAPPIRRLLPLRPIVKTYMDRVLVVGDAGGFTKPTTGGGIFYSLLTASLAAETLLEAFSAGRLDDAFLARYEHRWQERLGTDLRVADWLRQLVTKCTDAEIDLLVRAMDSEDVHGLIRRTARFNWHRDVIVALAREPRIATLIFRSLFR